MPSEAFRCLVPPQQSPDGNHPPGLLLSRLSQL
nr:MAG TPA: hypothetical protein [Caudoviricetes sp.]